MTNTSQDAGGREKGKISPYGNYKQKGKRRTNFEDGRVNLNRAR